MRNVTICAVILLVTSTAMAADATFEDLTLAPESYWDGSDASGGFTSGGFFFENNNSGWWKGWSYSNVTDNTTPGIGNEFSAIPGSGVDGSSNYGVAFGWDDPFALFGRPRTELAGPRVIDGPYFTNTTYAYLSMLNGDAFAKQFGGLTGDDEDWFLLTITGLNGETETGTVEFFLADYRFANNALDYIVDQWTWVDLTSLGEVTALEFDLGSSDVSGGFLNTPSYFAMDTLVPEPASMLLLTAGAMALLRRRK